MPLPPADRLCPLQAPQTYSATYSMPTHVEPSISCFSPAESPTTNAAFARALRAIAAPCAELVGHNRVLGMTRHPCVKMRNIRVSIFFRRLPCTHLSFDTNHEPLTVSTWPEFLNVVLPLLMDVSMQSSTSIAQLLGTALCTPPSVTFFPCPGKSFALWSPEGECPSLGCFRPMS